MSLSGVSIESQSHYPVTSKLPLTKGSPPIHYQVTSELLLSHQWVKQEMTSSPPCLVLDRRVITMWSACCPLIGPRLVFSFEKELRWKDLIFFSFIFYITNLRHMKGSEKVEKNVRNESRRRQWEVPSRHWDYLLLQWPPTKEAFCFLGFFYGGVCACVYVCVCGGGGCPLLRTNFQC